MTKWTPLVTICLGTFMLLIDVTIVNVALPDITTSLDASFSSLQWVVDGYALALAALLLGIGALADLVGHRRSYIAGLVLFALSSLACGLAPEPGFLVAARVVQGVGAAAMFATTFALLSSSYVGRDRGVAYGIWGAVAGAAAAIGPILGGALVEGLSWRWIFFVNLPVSVLAVVLCLRVLAPDGPRRAGRVDVPGTITFSVSAGTLTYALIRQTEVGWDASVGALLVVSALALAAFLAVQVRSPHALLDLGLFRSPSFGGTLVAAAVLSFAAFGSFTYTAIWLQSVKGLSPLEAGLTGLPLAVVSFFVSALIGRFLHDRAPGPVIATGLGLVGLGGVVEALMIGDGSSWPDLLPGFAVIGLGVGLAIPTLSSSAMASVPVQRGGMAAGAVNTFRQLGYAIGIAVLGSVFASQAATSLRGRSGSEDLAHELASGQAQRLLAQAGPGRAALDDALQSAATSAVHQVFLVSGLLGLAGSVVVLLMVRRPAPSQAPPPQEPATAAA
jgi:EmrB/QacA subfamily drug resistance transporter